MKLFEKNVPYNLPCLFNAYEGATILESGIFLRQATSRILSFINLLEVFVLEMKQLCLIMRLGLVRYEYLKTAAMVSISGRSTCAVNYPILWDDFLEDIMIFLL